VKTEAQSTVYGGACTVYRPTQGWLCLLLLWNTGHLRRCTGKKKREKKRKERTRRSISFRFVMHFGKNRRAHSRAEQSRSGARGAALYNSSFHLRSDPSDWSKSRAVWQSRTSSSPSRALCAQNEPFPSSRPWP